MTRGGSTARSLLAWITAALAVFAVLHFAAPSIERLLFPGDYRRFDSVQVGMPEGEVRALLGPPDLDLSAETAPDDYYVEGFSYQRRAISHRVLIFKGGEHVAYVYLDSQGRAEAVFVGGS